MITGIKGFRVRVDLVVFTTGKRALESPRHMIHLHFGFRSQTAIMLSGSPDRHPRADA